MDAINTSTTCTKRRNKSSFQEVNLRLIFGLRILQ